MTTPRPNLAPADFLRYYRQVADAKREVDSINENLRSARGVYRATLKAAKNAGVNKAMLIESMRIVTTADEDEVSTNSRDLRRYLSYLGSPIGQQLSLFGDDAASVSDDARAEHDEWAAHDQGYRAAQAGTPADECPHPLGSELAQSWSAGHAKGRRVIADFEAGNPAEPVKRRGRRARDRHEIVAGAEA